MTQSQKKWSAFGTTVLIVLVLDQLTKYLIRTNPALQNITIIDGWLEFFYTQNPGMAMGITWADTWIISLVAIVASILIMAYIVNTYKQANMGYMICMGLIMGGAIGNITDRLIMARIEGYGGVLSGHVVDFIHFSLRINDFAVFPYIFNVADIAISVAIVSLLIFHKKLLPEYQESEKESTVPPQNTHEETPESAETKSEIEATDSADQKN